MRDIKFRAWIPSRSVMLYDGQWFETRPGFADSGGDELLISSKGVYLKSMYANHQPMLLDAIAMQYTGLKDHKGVEIYEGDIIEHGNGDRFQVEDVTPPRKEMYYEYEHYDDFLSMSDVDYEVIGNIYHNPELLKESPS